MPNILGTLVILTLPSFALGGTVGLGPSDKEYSHYLTYAKKSYTISKDKIEIKDVKPMYDRDSSAWFCVIGKEKAATLRYFGTNDNRTINFRNIYFLESAEWKSRDIICVKVWLGRIFWYELYWDTRNNKEQRINLFLEEPENQKKP